MNLNGILYDPCYINTVAAANNKWPQILPTKGWSPANALKGGSNFALLYSMPYSTDIYCVSPSNVGNSASIMAAPASDETCGTRCLSILNSWDSGNNAISQTVTLPKGEYKLTFLAQYVCQNEMRHVNGYTVSTTGDNINYSRCGVCFGDTTIYKYPRQANHWKTVECPFELDKETDVTISLGLETTHGVGAAYNTRIYIDQVRLYSKRESSIDPAPAPDDPVGIAGIENVDEKNVDVYNLQGIKLRCNVPTTDATAELPQGIYIVGQKKVIRH